MAATRHAKSPDSGRPAPLKLDNHPARSQIIAQMVARISPAKIAAEHGISEPTLRSWFKKRVVPILVATTKSATTPAIDNEVALRDQDAIMARQSVEAASTLDLVNRKLARYDPMFRAAAGTEDVRAWAQVDRAETAALELRARLKGETQTTTAAPQVVVLFAEGAHQRLDLSAGKVIEPES